MHSTHPMIEILVDGYAVTVPVRTTVAAALAARGGWTTRRSVSGQPRAPLCGMGVCYECRVTINGVDHTLACQTLCSAGMHVRTAAAA